MKTLKILSIIIIYSFTASFSLFAQGFQPPAEGKAVIYFVHISKTQNIEYFHQDKYIGIFNSKSYMRVECDPGKQLFWASEENKEFVHCDLVEGGSYIVLGESKMGMWSARVKLIPITANDDKFFEKAKTLINKEAPVIIPESQIKKRNSELVEFVENIMDKYENEWKEKKDFPVITPDMAIPAEEMK